MPDLSAVEKAVYRSCIGQVVNASNGAINEKEAQALLKNLNQIKKLVMATNPTGNLSQSIPQVLAQALQDIKVGKLQKNFQHIKQRETFNNKVALVSTQPKAKGQLKAFYGNLLGSYASKDGGKFSTDVRMQSAVNLALSKLESMLHEQGLTQHFTKGIDEDKVALELNQLTLDKGKPGITGNKDALKVAQIIHNHRTEQLAEAARAGIFVPKLDGYISQQTHDPDTIRHAGKDAWTKSIMPRIDNYKTFGTLDPSKWQEAMHNKYLNITTGEHQSYEDGVDNKFIPAGSNLAAKAAAQRTIHFKSPQDAYEYSKEFGIRSFREQIISSSASLARRTALANEWGPNAEMNMRNVLAHITNNARLEEDTSTLRDLKGKVGKVALLGTPEQLLSEVLGKTRTPVQKNFWYEMNKWLVSLRSMASLGTSTISAQTDLINLVGHLATIEGSNPLMGMVRVASRYYRPSTTNEIDVARQCGVMAQALRAQLINDRFGDMDTTGVSGKLAAMYFKLNALHWHDQKITNVSAAMMANHFGEMSDTAHADLPLSTKTWLSRFAIGDKEWDGMRQHAFTATDGNKYLTPVASDKIDGISEEQRDLLRNKFASMFTDAANSTVPRAGARERMILYRGTAPDTILGSLLRLAALFKTFPVSMVSKILNRNIYGQASGVMSTAMSVAVLFAMYIVGGAAITTIKQTLSGKTTPTPTTVAGAKTMLAKSMTQGGGMGYLGDIALPEDDKEGLTANLLKGAAGPILGDAGTVADDLSSSIKNRFGDHTEKQNKEERQHLEKDAVNIGSNYVPFANHFATKFLFNYYIRYAILNAIDPDYTSKMEKNMKKQGTSFVIPPAVNAKK